jgi:uridine kinase
MFLVGIAGGSGSGKTTFAQKICRRLGHLKIGVLHQDSYYLPKPPEHLKTDGNSNFDHPEAFDWPLLREHLGVVQNGGSINVPSYDFTVSRRKSTFESMGTCDAVLLEGIFALWDEEIREKLDLKVFLHVDADIRIIRRIHRDISERGRSIESIIRQYYDTVRPMHRRFLEPTQEFADVSVGEETDAAAEVVAARVAEMAVRF